MTFDGPGGAVLSAVASLVGTGTDAQPQTLTTVVAGRGPGPWGANVSAYVGGAVNILYGPGLGGMSRVASVTPTDDSWTAAAAWTLDPPLLTRPVPGSSYVNIGPYRGGFIFEAVRWTSRNEGCTSPHGPPPSLLYNHDRTSFLVMQDLYLNDTTWQLWAQATDIVLAGSYFQVALVSKPPWS
jgi:hypothetical protein